MSKRLRQVAAGGLVIGAALGMAGSFVPSAHLRGLLWGVDGIAIIIASALLVVHHGREGNDQLAAGLLVFLAGETLIVATSAMDLVASVPLFGAGAGLWAGALALVSASPRMPTLIRGTGAVASVLLAVAAVRIFCGEVLTPLSKPLPYYAYPFLALTLLGWAWGHIRPQPTSVVNTFS